MYHRNLTQPLLSSLVDSPVVFLQGARQTGKSTLARWVASERHPARYLTLDDPGVLDAALGDPVGFIAAQRDAVVIDEAQRAPDLFFAIKQVVDQDRTPGKFLLTGSADVLLLPRVGEALTGRTELMTLHPLSQGELAGRVEGFVDALFESSTLEAPQGTEVTSDEIVSRVALGGYPEALRRRTAERRQSWFDAYVALLVQRDIQDLANIEHATAVPRILRLLAARSSSTLNYANLASDLQLPQTTLKRYLAYLETLFVHQPVPAWSANIGKRLVKSPKLALVDAGLAAALLGMSPGRLAEDRTLFGRLLESFVMCELRRQRTWSRTRPNVHHFRTHGRHEVDIVLEDRAGRVVGVEVKAAHSVTNADFAGLRLLKQFLGERFVQGVALHMGSQMIPFAPDLNAVPLWALWTVGAGPSEA